MFKKYFSPLIFVLLVFNYCSDNITQPNEVRQLTNIEKQVVFSSDEFGFKLFKKINEFEGEKNIFISPLSVSMALGMTLNGAAGTTYDAMQSALEFSELTNQEINEAYKSLIELLIQIDPKVILQIANSIWYRDNWTFEQEFIDLNKKYFNAEVAGLDFNDQNAANIINNWVDQNTNGKINKIIDIIPSDAIMYLINAIYFKGTWKYEFNKENTREDIFTMGNGEKINCQMMVHKNDFMYYNNSDFQAVDLPYGDGHFSMTIILPGSDKNVDDIIGQLNSTIFNNWLNNYEEKEGTIQLPKFKLEYEYLLNDVLKALGMEIAFSNHADFTNLYKPGGVSISKVKHKTFVQVDEEGTEAAAVTSVEVGTTSISNGFIMRIDKPFIFLIRESNSGSLLFIGKIIKPVFN